MVAGMPGGQKRKSRTKPWHSKGPTTERNCDFCSQRYTVLCHWLKVGKGLFCSKSCASRARKRTGPQEFIQQNPMDHIGLLVRVAHRYMKNRPLKYGYMPIQETDEFQAGFVGLMYACENFRGQTAFSTYAAGCMRDEIMLDRYGPRRRPRDGLRMFCSSEYWDALQRHDDGLRLVDLRDQYDVLDKSLVLLGEKERAWLYDHCALGMSFQQIGNKDHVSHAVVFSRVSRAIEFLRKELGTRLGFLMLGW